MTTAECSKRAKEAPVSHTAQTVAAIDAALTDAGLEHRSGLAHEVVDAGVAETGFTKRAKNAQPEEEACVYGNLLIRELAGAVSVCAWLHGSRKIHTMQLSADDCKKRSIQALWCLATDKIATRIMMDACAALGEPGPAQFMSLPSNAKLNVLASLPPSSLACAECVCRELRALSSDDLLWAPLFSNEFGQPNSSDTSIVKEKGWKAAFSARATANKRARVVQPPQQQHVHARRPPHHGMRIPQPYDTGGFGSMYDDLLPGGGTGGRRPPPGMGGMNPFFGGGGGGII